LHKSPFLRRRDATPSGGEKEEEAHGAIKFAPVMQSVKKMAASGGGRGLPDPCYLKKKLMRNL